MRESLDRLETRLERIEWGRMIKGKGRGKLWMGVYHRGVGREWKRGKRRKGMEWGMKGIGQIGTRRDSKSFIGKLRSLLYSISKELSTSTRKMGGGNSLRCKSAHFSRFLSVASWRLTCFESRFERRKRGESVSYHFVGYVSFYSFFCYPDTKRLRLAWVENFDFRSNHTSLLTRAALQQSIRHSTTLPRSRSWMWVHHSSNVLLHRAIRLTFEYVDSTAALYDLCYRNILKRSDISELTGSSLARPESTSFRLLILQSNATNSRRSIRNVRRHARQMWPVHSVIWRGPRVIENSTNRSKFHGNDSKKVQTCRRTFPSFLPSFLSTSALPDRASMRVYSDNSTVSSKWSSYSNSPPRQFSPLKNRKRNNSGCWSRRGCTCSTRNNCYRLRMGMRGKRNCKRLSKAS